MKIKIAFILYTEALEYDDRIRKESLSLLKNGDIEINIFTILANNKASKGITAYGVPFQSFSLKSRKIFNSASFLPLKALEFFAVIKPLLKEYNVIWVHNVQSFLFPLLSRNKKIIWDLHEVPFEFEKNFLKKALFKFLEKKCNYFIHANQYRIDYLIENKMIKHPEKHFVIRNFPDNNFETSEHIDDEWLKFSKWLNGSEYVYLQGLKQTMRYPEQVVDSIMQTSGLKAVVIGGFEKSAKERLIKKYGDYLKEKIYFRGKVDQLITPSYIKESKFSIVVYQTDYDANHLYCEANRLYQTIIFDKPVIVGCNPPMLDLINMYGFGVAMKSDGKNTEDIIKAISILNKNFEKFIINIKKNKEQIMWGKQEQVIRQLVNQIK
jgi:hypothetical protein